MDLENTFFYRLVNVFYHFFLLLYFIMTIVLLFDFSAITLKDTLNWLFFFIIYYSSLNLLKEALIYLAFGKKLTWNWVLRLFKPFLKSKEQA